MNLVTKHKKIKVRDKVNGRKSPRRTARSRGSENAGRPSLFPGKDISRHATSYLTKEGWNKLAVVQQELLRRYKDKVSLVSVSDAMEEGIHRLHHELTRPR